MKNLKIVILLVLVAVNLSNAEDTLNVNQKPEATQELEFQFPEVSELVVENGVKFYTIEDHSLPAISVSILLAGGESSQTVPGTAELLLDLLTKGTENRTAEQISNELDALGIIFNTNLEKDYLLLDFKFLKKNSQKSLELVNDIFNNLKIDEEIFESSKERFIGSINYRSADPDYMVSKLAEIAFLGENHPYTNIPNIDKIEDIQQQDVLNYFNSLKKANKVELIVSGNFEKEDLDAITGIIESLEKENSIDEDKEIESSETSPGVYFIPREGSVQTNLIVGVKAPGFTGRNYYDYDVISSILGGGIAGRMFRILREKYSFAYSPRAYVTGNINDNALFITANVRGDKTDSSLVVITGQLEDLSNNQVSEDELSRVISYKTGNYFMLMDDIYNFSSLILENNYKGRTLTTQKNYFELLKNVSSIDVLRTSQKIFDKSEIYIIAVGDPSIKQSLSKYGKIFEYTKDLQPKPKFSDLEKSKYDCEELIEEYADAIGGLESINNILSLKISSDTEMKMDGDDYEGITTTFYKKPGKYFQEMDMNSFKQKIWFVDGEAYIGSSNKIQQFGEDKEKIKYLTSLFLPLDLKEFGFKSKVLGETENEIIMEAVSPIGSKFYFYFDNDTYLLNKVESESESSSGKIYSTTIYSNYIEIGENRIKLPAIEKRKNQIFEISMKHSYEEGIELDEEIFYK